MSVEVLLPKGYKEGEKVTDKVMENLSRIYPDITFTKRLRGGYSNCIILNSYEPHDINNILTYYPPNRLWYYMYDMNWGRQWYEVNKHTLQLITDKDYPGSRFVIPNGMIALNEVSPPKHIANNDKLCIMESYKPERFATYDTILQQNEIEIDVIGTTMNKSYEHNHHKVDSVPYKHLGTLLQDYAFCFVLWDEYHDKYNLPIKVAECIENGVVPILDSRYGQTIFPTATSIYDIKHIMDKYAKQSDRELILDNIVWRYSDGLLINTIRERARLVETDWMFTEAIERVLVWGREKHRGHYWRDNLDVKDFMAAAKRHLDAYNSGEEFDDETNESHLIHAACNLMFQYRIDRDKII